MEYKFELMTQEQAEDIAYNWHYQGDFSFYDMESDREVLGFFSFTKLADHSIDIGLGMRPDLVSKGNGQDFLKAGLDFAKTTYHPKSITLSVATFNQRAIKVYKRIGFKEVHTFMQDTNGSRFEFLKMIYSVENS